MHVETQLIIFWIEILISRIQNNNLEFNFQLSSFNSSNFLKLKFKTSEFKYQISSLNKNI
jgi:hypothetical protein